jgi:glycosyltransferase involved in cell wall biosynthesis
MAGPDISVVLAVHREATYMARTWESLAQAAWFARSAGWSVELVAVLDRTDPATRRAVHACDGSAFSSVRVLEVDNGALGPTRNDGIAVAAGRYVATADGDDLVSYNYLGAMAAAADGLGPNDILIPKFVFAFGRTYYIAEYFDLSDVTPLLLLIDHPFLSRIFFARSLCDRLTYHDISGQHPAYAFEDWHFNCEAVALGCQFRAVPDSILFYRQRANTMLARANQFSSRQIPPTRLFTPPVYRRVCAPFVEGVERISHITLTGADIINQPVLLELTTAANAIDPAVDPLQLSRASTFNYLATSLAAPLAYYRLCEIVGDERFDEVFLLPYLTTGGADRYLLNIMWELTRINQQSRILVIFGQAFERVAWLDQLPPGAVHLDLIDMSPGVDTDSREVLCFKLLQGCAPNARLHMKSSAFAHDFFARFGSILTETGYSAIYYRFSNGRNQYGDLNLIEPSPFAFISENLEKLDLIVCDNEMIARADQQRLAVMAQKWQVLRSRVEVVDFDRCKAKPREGKTILWVSRIDDEKRPTLLIEIARQLAVRVPELALEVYGQATLGAFDVKRFAGLPNLRYHGPFEKFEQTRPDEHACFVYTSCFDGIPVVLLEAMAAGLPIIAPDVGAIPEIIEDARTGLLIRCSGDDEADALHYVARIEALLADPTLQQRVVEGAWAMLMEHHSPPSYAARVERIFRTAPRYHGSLAGVSQLRGCVEPDLNRAG